MSELIPRTTVVEVVARRNQAIGSFVHAFQALKEAHHAFGTANGLLAELKSRHSHFYLPENLDRFYLHGLMLPNEAEYVQLVAKLVDASSWGYLMEITGIDVMMDKTAKDEFRKRIETDPPEVTEENVAGALHGLFSNRDFLFKRGIATAFSKLDKRFRSHDGWKIGSRVILSGAFNEVGSWSHYRHHRDTLIDIERTFLILDSRQTDGVSSELVGEMEKARCAKWGAKQFEVETEFFRVRVFLNGNAHIWFKRADLVEKVNKLLGEYYGGALPEERSAAYREDAERRAKMEKRAVTPAKNFGFYPSPEPVVAAVLEWADAYRRDGATLKILEPSAGNGAIAIPAMKYGQVTAIEIQQSLVDGLRASGLPDVIAADFFDVTPRAEFDLALMNPPFDYERDIDHVLQAMKWLKPDGQLVAVMSAGTLYRSTIKSQEFRGLTEKLGGDFRDLPMGSFSSVGTEVNTVLVKVNMNGRKVRW